MTPRRYFSATLPIVLQNVLQREMYTGMGKTGGEIVLFLMGWRTIQTWISVAIADESPNAIDFDIAENLRQSEQNYFLERRSLL
jgi:hypothetical protein